MLYYDHQRATESPKSGEKKMNTLTYEEQLQRARAIAVETGRYAEQDEEQRDKWLDDALNNSYHEGITLNEWLRLAGYAREVSHDEIVASAREISGGGQSGEETVAIWDDLSLLEDVNGDGVPSEWRDVEELRRFLDGRTIVELPRT